MKLSDEWQTPRWLFDELNREFNFDIDLCATVENTKKLDFCEDYLNNIVTAQNTYMTWNLHAAGFHRKYKTAFMNPPYSNPKPFIEKAWEDSKYCKIVCLVKCDPSTKWWATFWNYEESDMDKEDSSFIPRGPKFGCEVRFFPKRIKFDPSQQLIDKGEVWKVTDKWVQKCENCLGDGQYTEWNYLINKPKEMKLKDAERNCIKCKGKGYLELSGPTFPSCLVIMDRRNL